MTAAIPFFQVEDSAELRLYYEFLSAGLSAFIIKWVLDDSITEAGATELLAEILLHISTQIPIMLSSQT